MALKIPTPHISAAAGEFVDTVLMPGDPLRAKFIADNFLENAKQVTAVRNMLGFTGTYKGKPVSIVGSGMGMPSIGIYSYELFAGYGVENIIRIGSAGSMREDVHVRDLVIAMGACTDSNWGAQYNLTGTFAPIADMIFSAAPSKRPKSRASAMWWEMSSPRTRSITTIPM